MVVGKEGLLSQRDIDMKTLLIMRHGKSSWAKPSQADHDRTLNDRGRLDVPLMGQKLKEEGLLPGLVISSSAMRAQETAQLVTASCGYEGKIEVLAELYMASETHYFEALHQLGNDHDCVLIIGHNPTIESVIDLYAVRPAYITPGNIGHITFDVETWAEVMVHTNGRLLNLWRPSEL